MHSKRRFALTLALALGCAAGVASARPPALPLRFEEIGVERNAAFVARMPGYSLALSGDGATLAFAEPARSVRLRVAGVGSAATLAGEEPAAAPSHYLLGNDPQQWRRGVRAFERVRARGVQPGVDLVYYGAEGELELDWIARAGVDPASLELVVEGADVVSLAEDGALALRVGERTLALRAPVAYQERGAVREPVAARYELRADHRVGFAVGAHDPTRALVIDPVLSVASYFGGSRNDEGRAVAIDASGAIYLVGETLSLDLPVTAGAVQPSFGGGVQDVFVAKLDPSGAKLLWATYLGGSLHDRGFAIAVDAYGGAVITGRTGSSNFPTVAPLQATFAGGGDDAFVAKLAPDGASLDFSTYLGGAANDRGLAIGVDANGEIRVGGITLSANFPTRSPFQASYGGGSSDGFVAKLAAGGAALRFSSYIGGSGSDNVRGLALDAAGRTILCGDTDSANFPVASAMQPALAGTFDAWVGRVDAAGAALAPATYFGGSGTDFALGCDASASGEAVLAGVTDSTDLPVLNAAQATRAGGQDAFVAKLDAALATRVYATYLGGSATDFGLDVALDPRGGATLVGSSASTNYPVQNAIQSTNGGGFDTIATKLGASGALEWSTYLGGSGGEIAFDRMGVAIDPQGRPVVTGITLSTNHPLAVPIQPTPGGADDAFFARIGVAPEVRVTLLPDVAGTRFRLSLASGAVAAQQVELKIWVGLPGGVVFGLTPDPLLLSLAQQSFTQLLDVVLPAALPFPSASVGARLLDPATGATRSESVCWSIPCN